MTKPHSLARLWEFAALLERKVRIIATIARDTGCFLHRLHGLRRRLVKMDKGEV